MGSGVPGNGAVVQSANAESRGCWNRHHAALHARGSFGDCRDQLRLRRIEAGGRSASAHGTWQLLRIAGGIHDAVPHGAGDGRTIGMACNRHFDALAVRTVGGERNVALPAAPQHRFAKLIEETIARITANVEFGRSAMSAAVDDVVKKDSGRLAHVDRFHQGEVGAVRDASGGILRRELNVGNEGIAPVLRIDLTGGDAFDFFELTGGAERFVGEDRDA